MSKEITEKNSFAISDQKPDYIKNSNRGQENVGARDITIPRLDVLQDLSPKVKKRDPEYIEGAEPGILFNTVSNQLYGTAVYFVPVYFKMEWLIWKLQSAGGGFCGSYDSEKEAITEFANQKYGDVNHKVNGVDTDSYEIIDTAQHYGMILHEDKSVEQIVCSMSRSKMKVSRQLNTLCKLAGGDRFSHVYKIASTTAKNPQNQDYWNLKVRSLGYTPEKAYKQGEKMYELVSTGERTANMGEAPVKNKESESEEY